MMPDNAITLSGGAGRLSFTSEQPVYSYENYYYGELSGTAKKESIAISPDLGIAIKLAGANAELGFSTRSMIVYNFSLKWGLTDPEGSLVHAALDTGLHLSPFSFSSLSFSSGLIVNVALLPDMPLDLILGAYYQAAHITNTYTYGTYYRTPANSMYYYAGFEFPMRKDALFCAGAGYTKAFDSNTTPNELLYFSVGVKAIVKGPSPAQKPGSPVYQSDIPADLGRTAADYLHEAGILMADRDFFGASELLSTGLKSYPGDNSIKKMLADAHYAAGDKRGALKIYYEILEDEPWNKALRITAATIFSELKAEKQNPENKK